VYYSSLSNALTEKKKPCLITPNLCIEFLFKERLIGLSRKKYHNVVVGNGGSKVKYRCFVLNIDYFGGKSKVKMFVGNYMTKMSEKIFYGLQNETY
jgi:hypothetical protein